MEDTKKVFHVFTNTHAPNTYAITFDKEGSCLPIDYPKEGAAWKYFKSFTGGLEGRIAFGLEDEKTAEAAIEKDGYYLHKMERLLKKAP